jgi:hypothetical protein
MFGRTGEAVTRRGSRLTTGVDLSIICGMDIIMTSDSLMQWPDRDFRNHVYCINAHGDINHAS